MQITSVICCAEGTREQIAGHEILGCLHAFLDRFDKAFCAR